MSIAQTKESSPKFTYMYIDILGWDITIPKLNSGHWLKIILPRSSTSPLGMGTSLLLGYNLPNEDRGVGLILPIELYWTLRASPYSVRWCNSADVLQLYFLFTFWGKTVKFGDSDFIGFGNVTLFDWGIEWHPCLGASIRGGFLLDLTNKFTTQYVGIQLHLGGWVRKGKLKKAPLSVPKVSPKIISKAPDIQEDTIPDTLFKELYLTPKKSYTPSWISIGGGLEIPFANFLPFVGVTARAWLNDEKIGISTGVAAFAIFSIIMHGDLLIRPGGKDIGLYFGTGVLREEAMVCVDAGFIGVEGLIGYERTFLFHSPGFNTRIFVEGGIAGGKYWHNYERPPTWIGGAIMVRAGVTGNIRVR